MERAIDDRISDFPRTNPSGSFSTSPASRPLVSLFRNQRQTRVIPARVFLFSYLYTIGPTGPGDGASMDNVGRSGQEARVHGNADLGSSPKQPESEYAQRLAVRKPQLERIERIYARLWTYFVLSVLAALLTVYAGFSSHTISPIWTLLPLVGLIAITQSLSNNARAHSRIQRIVNFYELGVARLHDLWQGRGIGGEEFLPDDHSFASDLDLFGAGSLFEFLCTARTSIGRSTLANWLLNPADCSEVKARQSAVAELRDRLDLREHWASLEGNGPDDFGSSLVHDWADAAAISFHPYVRALGIALPLSLAFLGALAYVGIVGHHWIGFLAVPLGMEVFLAGISLKKSRSVAANAGLPSLELAQLGCYLDSFAAQTFHSPKLRSLQSQVADASGGFSSRIRRLTLLVRLLGLRQNETFAIPASLLLWGTNLAIFIERWRQKNKAALVAWIISLGEFEALLCLSRYYYENPDHRFPVLSSHSSAQFNAEALGHPLLDGKTCVRSNIKLDTQGTRLIIVSGSNMAGKSTLLRSVGLNAVLALAGAPVRATHLQISSLHIGCSISIHDSLLMGKSKFQAEVERLKLIMALSRSGNLLFLLDEILAGTNSNDRFFGARAVIERLAENGGVGLVTTHDLTITEIVRVLEDQALNVHFEEYYENGEMRCDYVMRPGVLTHTNGLKVMAALGLVPESAK
jgi:hypothetical protein